MVKPDYSDVLVGTVPTYTGSKDIRLNIFLPQNTTPPYKTLLFIHGGAFMMGDYTMNFSRSSFWPDLREEFTKKGMAVVSLGYRLATEACFPAQIHDIKGCVRFIRKHGSDFGLDTVRLGVTGESAGGYLSAMLALTAGAAELEGDVGGNLEQSSAVQYAAPIYGVFNMLTSGEFDPMVIQAPEAMDHTSPESPEGRVLGLDKIGLSIPELTRIMQAGDERHPHYDKVRLAIMSNPAAHITKDAPPMFIGHGDSDGIVPLEQSLDLFAALCRANTEVVFVNGHLQYHGQDFNPRLKARLFEWIADMAM